MLESMPYQIQNHAYIDNDIEADDESFIDRLSAEIDEVFQSPDLYDEPNRLLSKNEYDAAAVISAFRPLEINLQKVQRDLCHPPFPKC